MTAILLAVLAGISFGALTVAVQWGMRRYPDPEVGAFAAAAIGTLASTIVAAPIVARGIVVGEYWPYFGAGLIAPGASQIFLTLAVRHAGSSRTAILMGMAPFISILAAILLLGESVRPLTVLGTVLIVTGGVTLASERGSFERFRLRGGLFALICAVLFAARDNTLRFAARDHDPEPLVAAATSLLAGSALIFVYLAISHRHRLRSPRSAFVAAFVPAGLALALGYTTLLMALDRGLVSVVSPLHATGSLWALLFATLVIGPTEVIGRRTVIAAMCTVAGSSLIGIFR